MTNQRTRLPWHLFKTEHKAVGRSVCLALGAADPDAYFSLSQILCARLELEERAALAFAAMRSLAPDYRWMVMEGLGDVERPNGSPLPPFSEEIIDDANWWASSASKEELRAYLRAIINYMDEDDKKIVARNILGNK